MNVRAEGNGTISVEYVLGHLGHEKTPVKIRYTTLEIEAVLLLLKVFLFQLSSLYVLNLLELYFIIIISMYYGWTNSSYLFFLRKNAHLTGSANISKKTH